MPEETIKQVIPRKRGVWLRRLLAALLLLSLALGARFYWQPVATMTAVQRCLLALSGVESKFAQLGPHRIHYLAGGDGPPLLLLHGHPSKAEEWAPLLPKLTRKHRVIALDFLGYGESDAPDVDYSIATQSGVVTGLLDALQINKADVLGFSMGGWIALKFASDHPERVRRLVLVDSGGLKFPTALTADSFVPKTLAEFRQFETLQSDRRLPDFIARDLLRRAQERAWVVRRSGAALLSFAEVLDGQLTNVRMPVLIIWGKADRLIPYDVALRLQRELPQAKLVGLDGCSHMVLWDCRERALPEVISFLE